MTGSTAFDVVVVVLLLISVGLSVRRGLIRESFSIITLCAGVMCGYLSLVFLRAPVLRFFPEGWPEFVLSGLVIVFGFLGAYIVSAWIGERLSHLAHSVGDLGILDSLAGAGFGLARAIILIVVFHIAVERLLPEADIPDAVRNTYSYPYIETAANWVEGTLPGLYEKARDATGTLPES